MQKRVSVHNIFQQSSAILITLSGAAALLFLSKPAAAGATLAMQRCAAALIPSLFPFMVLSAFGMHTGVFDDIGKVFSPFMRHAFHLPACATGALLLSLTGGYPVGAQCVKTLYQQKKITLRQAQHMVLFCFGAGPCFVISVAGITLLGNAQAGILLYLSQVVSAVVLGFLLSRSQPPAAKAEKPPAARGEDLSTAFVASVETSCRSMLLMCAYVILFGTIGALLQSLFTQAPGIFQYGTDILFEVTAGIHACAAHFGIPWMAFALGWGGLSVHFQIFALAKELCVSKQKFFLCRLFQGGFSALVCWGLSPLLTVETSTEALAQWNTSLSVDFYRSGLLFPALFLMCVVFLFSLPTKSMKKR